MYSKGQLERMATLHNVLLLTLDVALMLLHRLQCFPNNKSSLAQRLLETHSFQGLDISFVLPTRGTSDSYVLSVIHI